MKHLLVAVSLAVVAGCGEFISQPPQGGEHTVASLQGPPCEQPVRWRIGAVDARFGLGSAEFTRAVEGAIAVWESASSFKLFENAPEDGLPISLVYDYRQLESKEMHLLQREMRSLESIIKREQADLDDTRERLVRARRSHDRLVAEFNSRIEEINFELGYWNRQGGPPEGEQGRLEDATHRLRSEEAAIEASAIDIRSLGSQAETAAKVQNERIELYNRLVRAFNARYSGRKVQSAVYEEVTTGSRSSRNIKVYQFDEPQHLVLVLAHELGHALGIDHAADPMAIMFEEYTRENYEYPVRLQEADRRALQALCDSCRH